MRVGIAADHGGWALKGDIEASLRKSGHEFVDFGAAEFDAADDYPDFVIPLARAVANGSVARGIALCGSGVGASVAANKVRGVRAGLIHDAFSARQGVEDDDMNVLCMGGKVIDAALAGAFVDIFLAARFSGADRHRRRLAKVLALEGISASANLFHQSPGGGPEAMVRDLDVGAYRIEPGCAAGLMHRPTRVDALHASDQAYQAQLSDHIARLSAVQGRFYADNGHALLVIFQGMDAAGKDGTIAHVMSAISPQGCDVFDFKQPSAEELQHDFLWRSNKDLPERGKIGIFNRSYYEEVLILRVHPELLRREGLRDTEAATETLWDKRYRSINALEQHLHDNGTRVLKIFLHVSEQEQIKRFIERIDNPNKTWKLSLPDVAERQFWNAYARAYDQCLTATGTVDAPWFVVPADDKATARLIVSQILLNALNEFDLAAPVASAERRLQLAGIRAQLVAAAAGAKTAS